MMYFGDILSWRDGRTETKLMVADISGPVTKSRELEGGEDRGL